MIDEPTITERTEQALYYRDQRDAEKDRADRVTAQLDRLALAGRFVDALRALARGELPPGPEQPGFGFLELVAAALDVDRMRLQLALGPGHAVALYVGPQREDRT
jgi:hypothetical protein